jgi:hypothetical protein
MLLALLLGASIVVGAPTPPPKPEAPTNPLALNLAGHDLPEWTQGTNEPLLLLLSIGNTAAQNMASQNRQRQRELTQLQNKPEIKALSPTDKAEFDQMHQPAPIPTAEIGEAGKPPAATVQFVIKNAAGKEISFPVRPLADTLKEIGVIKFDETQSRSWFYGADPEKLAELPLGTYTIEAHLSARDAHGAKLPDAVSNLARFTLTRPDTAPETDVEKANLSDYRNAGFYLYDHQYPKVDPYVEQMLKRDPKSIGAWERRGDEMAGLGRKQEAKQAYYKALDNFAGKYAGQKDIEYPEYLENRLRDLK